ARYGTVLMAVIVTLLALLDLALIGQLVAVAFSLAGCTIFPLFLMGIWSSRSNQQGAIAGLIAGGLTAVVALTYFIVGENGGTLPGMDFVSYYLGPWYFAWIGAPLAIVVNMIVSRFTKETPVEIRKFLVEEVHS
ncbi:MAG: hypothetical protein RQ866_04190, partial [Bacteroidales bacterium]|nr:hypothetical protein [Bacteroidales bacterium]